MKNKIIAGVVVFVLLLICCFTAPMVKALEQQEESIITPRITSYYDENLNNYSIEELNNLILEQKNIQDKAAEIASHARELEWPEDCDTIIQAQNEWANAQIIIDYYMPIYETKLENQKWANKKSEYPIATEIWLYMKDLGWNDYICAGILGNMMTEAGGQTLNIQPDIYSSSKGFYGICQWGRSYYPAVIGKDLKYQCNFLRDTIKYEIDTFGYKYQRGFDFNSFLAMSNEKNVALAFAKAYERCGSGSYSIRQKNATVAYNYFVNN